MLNCVTGNTAFALYGPVKDSCGTSGLIYGEVMGALGCTDRGNVRLMYDGSACLSEVDTSISCYLPANVSTSDTTGTFVYIQNCYYTAFREIKKPERAFLFCHINIIKINAGPWRGSMQMRRISSQSIVCPGYVNPARPASRYISCLRRCLCIWHSDAASRSGLTPCLRWWCI